MKILFLVPYPTSGASNRVRVEQFIPYLRSKGVRTRVRSFVNKPFYRILYLPERHLAKSFWFCICTLNRVLDIFRAVFYDIVFIQREAYPFGGPFFESILHTLGKRIVFDFDDAIFLPNTSKENKYIDRFKRPDKTARIIGMSRAVIAGNDYLGAFARKYNANVTVIPSSVDTDRYVPAARQGAGRRIVIGWIGSSTTKDFLPVAVDALACVSKRHAHVSIKIVGATFDEHALSNVTNKEWSLEDEIADLQSFDIGIMPLPDNEWGRGKCGFKAILYMACGLPVVASPVGVNSQIVDDGVTGFLARSTDEWIASFEKLIGDKVLRDEMGRKGRQRVVERYSIHSSAPLMYRVLLGVVQGSSKNGACENE